MTILTKIDSIWNQWLYTTRHKSHRCAEGKASLLGALLKQELVRNRDLLFWGSGVAPKQEEADHLNLKKFGYFRTEKEISRNIKGIFFLKVENSKTLPKLKSDLFIGERYYKKNNCKLVNCSTLKPK